MSSLLLDLLGSARKLVANRVTHADLRRATSTAYCAVFHALTKSVADSRIGSDENSSPNKAWVKVYRGMSHGTAAEPCRGAARVNFPEQTQDFAIAFVDLMDIPHVADYDPTFELNSQDVSLWIETAEDAIDALNRVSESDKK
jgi:uncharacterized protein (UPF0332 family)